MSAQETFRIRQARPDDEPAIVACVEAAYALYVPRIGKPPAPMLADYAAAIRAGIVHVLELGSEFAGVIVMFPRQRQFFVENVAVWPALQGRGIGRRLMAFAERRAREGGFGEVRLYTNEVMTENIGFYEKLGYDLFEKRLEDGYRRLYFRKPIGATAD